MKDRVTNTTDQMNNDPLARLLFLAQGMGPGGPSAAIEAQEAEGQKELARSESLPTECSAADVHALQHFGVELGEPFQDDKLFRPAKLPPGWKVVPDEGHSMGLFLVDEKGRKRASIFYKAAFYDRKANMHVLRRYSIEYEYVDLEGKPVNGYLRAAYSSGSRCVAKDGDTVLFATDSVAATDDTSTAEERAVYFKQWDGLRDEVKAWLNAHFPLWENPIPYWDMP